MALLSFFMENWKISSSLIHVFSSNKMYSKKHFNLNSSTYRDTILF